MARWLLWTILAISCWGLWAVLAKLIGDSLSPVHSQALSTLGILPVLAALATVRRRATAGNRGRGLGFAFGAGLVTCLGNIAYYDTLNRGAKAAAVVPLTALYPMVTVLLAVIFLRERLNRVQLGGVLCALAAIYFFNVPQEGGAVSRLLVLALLPIGLWGVAGLFQKLATNQVSGEHATLAFLLAFLLVSIVLLVAEPLRTGPTTRTWALVVGLGFAFALGNYAILAAFASGGKASVIAPLAGLYPLVSIPIALVGFHERVGPREAAGALLALVAVAALAWESPTPRLSSQAPPLNP